LVIHFKTIGYQNKNHWFRHEKPNVNDNVNVKVNVNVNENENDNVNVNDKICGGVWCFFFITTTQYTLPSERALCEGLWISG